MSINEIKKISDGTDEIETPFEGDFLGRKALADSLEGYVSRLQVGATIAIDAEWGAGKSWFVNHWKKQLENSKFKVIYLNAFSQDYIDDPFLTISMEIANHLDANEEKIEKLKKGISKVWRSFLPHAPMLIFSAITTLAGGGFFAQRVNEVINEIKNSGDFSEELGKVLNEKLEEHITEQVENYQKEKQSLEYFKDCLKNITEKQDKPIIFIVDELDRCKPEFSIRLIERIKHFFDVPKVVFVLSMNKNQLEESINSYYGFTRENDYLNKFIDNTIILKHASNTQVDYALAVTNFVSNLGLELGDKSDLLCIVELCKILNPNPRSLVRVLNKFSFLYKENFTIEQKTILILILFLLECNDLKQIDFDGFRNLFLKYCENFYRKEYDIYVKNSSSHVNAAMNIPTYLLMNKFSKTALESLFIRFRMELKHKPEMLSFDDICMYYPDLKDREANYGFDLIKKWYDYIYFIDKYIS